MKPFTGAAYQLLRHSLDTGAAGKFLMACLEATAAAATAVVCWSYRLFLLYTATPHTMSDRHCECWWYAEEYHENVHENAWKEPGNSKVSLPACNPL